MKNKSVKELRLLYVAPRYHTNQVPVMRGFHKYNCQVMFMAQYEGVGEVHDNVDFRLMKKSLLSKLIFKVVEKKYGPSHAEGIKARLFLPAFFHTLRTIKGFNPDLVVYRERYPATLAVYLICKMLGIRKNILYVQQPIYDNEYMGGGFKNSLKKLLFPKVTFSPILFHGKKRSKEEKSDLYFVPLVVEGKDSALMAERTYFEDGVIRFLDIGKYRDYKNHFFLIDAFDGLKKKISLAGVKLTIIGQVSNCNEEAYFEKLKNYIAEKELQDVIEVRKGIPYEEMDALYRKHDVLLLPSTYESAGMVIPEAMEKGLCVVTSIYCGLGSYLEEYDCGYTFPLNDTRKLEEIIMSLMVDGDLIRQKGRESVKAVQEHLLFENYLEKLSELTEAEFDYSLFSE